MHVGDMSTCAMAIQVLVVGIYSRPETKVIMY